MKNGQNPYIDAHCHLSDHRFDPDRDQVIQAAQKQGIGAWVQGGYSPEDWAIQLELRKRYGTGIIPVFGLHPMWVSEQPQDILETGLKQLESQLEQAAGIGELGLDYRKKVCLSPEIQAKQQIYFKKQLELNRDFKKPLVLHIVHAHGDALSVLKNYAPFPGGGIVHSFSGSHEVAREYISLGFLLSIGGGVTQNGFQKLKNTLTYVPFDRIVIETDAPDQLPNLPELGDQSALNQPAYLVNLARYLETQLGRTASEILEESSNRIRKLFL